MTSWTLSFIIALLLFLPITNKQQTKLPYQTASVLQHLPFSGKLELLILLLVVTKLHQVLVASRALLTMSRRMRSTGNLDCSS